MKVVYARADKVPGGLGRYFKHGKKYPALDMIGEHFAIEAENGVRYQFKWGASYTVTWTRIEYPYRDPQSVEEMIADMRLALDAPMIDHSGKGRGVFDILRKALARLEGGEV